MTSDSILSYNVQIQMLQVLRTKQRNYFVLWQRNFYERVENKNNNIKSYGFNLMVIDCDSSLQI